MPVQTKRLFVGGLSSATNEKDIRERFKTFGSVLSVEVHKKQKSEGFPEKTFAYVDIDASDSNIQRCITVLSNTKWKGGILKIQLAKESFLSRLQREREEMKSKSDGKESKSYPLASNLTSAAPNALPGTLIPGKKDWVVGKFGRVLPIVHMRQMGSHKLCRIDPSRTVHNLKRIKDDSDERPVSELTWSLEKENDDKVFINGNKHEEESDDSDSSSSEETNSVPANKKKKRSSRKNENMDDSENMEIFEGKGNKKDSSLTKYFAEELSGKKGEFQSFKVEEGLTNLDDNDNVVGDDSMANIDSADENIKSSAQAKSNEKKNKKRKTLDSNDSNTIDSIPDSSSSFEKKKRKGKNKKEDPETNLGENSFQSTKNESILLDNKTDSKNTQIDSEKHNIMRDSKTTLDEKIDEKKKDKRKESKREKNLKDSMLSENQSMTNEPEISKKKKREKETTQCNKEIKIVESRDKNNDSQKKKPLKIKKENLAKKLASNEKRLQAAKEREASSMSKQSLIASALKNLDSKDEKVKISNHIKFDDDEYEEEELVVGEKEKKTEGKISGSKASNWLGLDSASDDDEEFADKEGEDHLFAAKPQFEGETGHKLFKLQKSYKGDSRFQLDERFAESDSESEPEDEDDTRKHSRHDTGRSSDSDVEVTNDDEISKQLSREKELSMSVLRGILGHNVFVDNSSTKDKLKDSTMIHYDPTRDDHAQFEQIPKKQDERPEPAVKEKESQQEATEVMRSTPEVTREKFYDVKTNALTEMFGKNKSNDNTTTFKFLSNQDTADDAETAGSNWGETEELRSKPWNPIMLPYDSSGDEEEDMEHEEEQQHVQIALEERFFFHFGDPDLERRVTDEDSSFTRTQSLDELNDQWIATRSDLTQDYKKKHKDAVKRQSKMAAKRSRTR